MCNLFVMGILNMNVLFVTRICIELPAIYLLGNIQFWGGGGGGGEAKRSLSRITFIISIRIFIQHNMCVSVLQLIDEI